ncbi:Di-copper centre-containing domain superfamily protein [Pleurotus pulmonarius]
MVLKAALGRPLILLFVPLLLLSYGRADHHKVSEQCESFTVRREWRTLSKEERASWVDSVKCLHSIRHQRLSFAHQKTLMTKLHPSLYEDFSYAHAELDKTAHVTPYFLPWHRWILWMFEMRLRDSCGYTGPMPYWDWSLDTEDLTKAPVFDPDPEHGLGGGGDCYSTPLSDCTVETGAFSMASQTPVMLSFPIPHLLRRNFSLYPYEHGLSNVARNLSLTRHNIHNIMKQTEPGDYYMFQHRMTKVHNQVHNFVGGDLMGTCPMAMDTDECGSFTSNDPIFWLHHGQVDRIWVNWQNLHPQNFNAFAGAPLHPKLYPNATNWKDYTPNASIEHIMMFDRISAPVPIGAVFNISEPPFCYKYDDDWER